VADNLRNSRYCTVESNGLSKSNCDKLTVIGTPVGPLGNRQFYRSDNLEPFWDTPEPPFGRWSCRKVPYTPGIHLQAYAWGAICSPESPTRGRRYGRAPARICGFLPVRGLNPVNCRRQGAPVASSMGSGYRCLRPVKKSLPLRCQTGTVSHQLQTCCGGSRPDVLTMADRDLRPGVPTSPPLMHSAPSMQNGRRCSQTSPPIDL
jgi:hypothetical protein